MGRRNGFINGALTMLDASIEEIVLCDKCKGYGKLIDYDDREHDKPPFCTRCDGEGRLKKITIIKYKKMKE